MQVYNKEVSHAKNGEIKNCFHEKTTRAIKIENLSIDINIDARLRRLGGLLLLPALLERAVRQSTATYTPISIAISVLVGVAAAEEVDAGRLTGEEADRRRTIDAFTLLFLHQRLCILWIHYVALSRQVRTVLLLRINTGHAAQPAKDSLPNNHSITKFLTQIYEKEKEGKESLTRQLQPMTMKMGKMMRKVEMAALSCSLQTSRTEANRGTNGTKQKAEKDIVDSS